MLNGGLGKKWERLAEDLFSSFQSDVLKSGHNPSEEKEFFHTKQIKELCKQFSPYQVKIALTFAVNNWEYLSGEIAGLGDVPSFHLAIAPWRIEKIITIAENPKTPIDINEKTKVIEKKQRVQKLKEEVFGKGKTKEEIEIRKKTQIMELSKKCRTI